MLTYFQGVCRYFSSGTVFKLFNSTSLFTLDRDIPPSSGQALSVREMFRSNKVIRTIFINRSLISQRQQRHSSSSPHVVCDPTIGITADQAEFYKVARSFADAELRPLAPKWDREGTFPHETYKKLGELGFAGIFVRGDVGGSELNRVDTTVIVEALSTGCVGTTAMLTIHNMCAGMIDRYGNDLQRTTYLPKMCQLDLKASYCLTEPGSGSDAASLSTKALYDVKTNEYVVNGGKAFISGAGDSDLYLVMSRTGTTSGSDSISCLIIPATTKGLSFGANENKMGWKVQPTRQVIFEDCRVPAANLVGKEGQGFQIAMAGLDGGRLSIAACSLGAAQACFEIALNYVKERKQFGKSIASNQAIQFKLADMAGKLVSSRLVLRNAAALLDAKHPAARAHCALAKKIVTDYGFEICNDALQMHGGYGYLHDYHIERYLRDVRVHQILEGTNEIMRHIVGRALVA